MQRLYYQPAQPGHAPGTDNKRQVDNAIGQHRAGRP